MGKISVRGPIGPRYLNQRIDHYINTVKLIGNQGTAVDYITDAGRIRNSQGSSQNQFQESFIIIGPPGTGKTFVICVGSLRFINRSDNTQLCGTRRLCQVAIGTLTNSAADRIVEQFDLIFNELQIPINQRTALVKRIIRSDSEIRENVRPYRVTAFKEPSTSENDWNGIRDDVNHSRIIVGTVYQIENVLKGSSRYSLPRIEPSIILIDEASQINLSKLNLAFHLANRRLEAIGLIGDPYQLPPINQILDLKENAISSLRGEFGIPRRVSREIILNHQRRMYPTIRKLSESVGQYPIVIRDDPDTFTRDLGRYEGPKDLDSRLEDLFSIEKRIVLLDDSSHPLSSETRIGTSKINVVEENATDLIARAFKICYPDLSSSDIVAIVPYRAQITSMQTEDWRVGTVDAFQGQESSLVIASTIRTDSDSPLDFVANRNRLNVMISRAKSKLVILNYKTAFQDDRIFQDIYSFINNNPRDTLELEYDEEFEVLLQELIEEFEER